MVFFHFFSWWSYGVAFVFLTQLLTNLSFYLININSMWEMNNYISKALWSGFILHFFSISLDFYSNLMRALISFISSMVNICVVFLLFSEFNLISFVSVYDYLLVSWDLLLLCVYLAHRSIVLHSSVLKSYCYYFCISSSKSLRIALRDNILYFLVSVIIYLFIN